MMHSPGPFSVGATRGCAVEILDAKGCEVARVDVPFAPPGVDSGDLRDGNVRLLCAAGQMLAAVNHALNRVQTDADFRWHMLGTETMWRLVRLEAAIRGENEEVVNKRRTQWARKHADPEPEIVEKRRRVEQLEALLEAKFIPVPDPLPSPHRAGGAA